MTDSFRLPIDIEAFIRDSMRPTSGGGGVLVGSHGDMLYQTDTGLGAVPSTLGSGYMVMVSRGEGFAPEMIDLLDLIAFITGGGNLAFVFLSSVPIPGLLTSLSVNSATAASASLAPVVPLPSISIGTNVSSATAASHTATSSVPISSIVTSTQVIP